MATRDVRRGRAAAAGAAPGPPWPGQQPALEMTTSEILLGGTSGPHLGSRFTHISPSPPGPEAARTEEDDWLIGVQ